MQTSYLSDTFSIKFTDTNIDNECETVGVIADTSSRDLYFSFPEGTNSWDLNVESAITVIVDDDAPDSCKPVYRVYCFNEA
jgi:hypothetical protein